MTKTQLQQELLEKVKPGTKPSHLKKLKKSKSASDLPDPSSTRLSELETENAELKKELEQTSSALSELTKLKSNPPTQLLQDQLSEKQKEIELLRQQREDSAKQIESLRETSQSLRQQLENQLNPTELDNSLIARHKNLKDWFTQYQKNQELDAELTHNIDEVSNELITQDQTISNLQNQLQKLKLTNQQLTKDLNLTQKLAEFRKDYPFNPHPDYLKYAFYSLVALVLALWLLPKEK